MDWTDIHYARSLLAGLNTAHDQIEKKTREAGQLSVTDCRKHQSEQVDPDAALTARHILAARDHIHVTSDYARRLIDLDRLRLGEFEKYKARWLGLMCLLLGGL